MFDESLQSRPAFAMPSGACDCHVHLIGPHEQFPLARDRLYTPGPATLADLRAHQARLGLERAVIVHATPQRDDAAYLFTALEESPRNLRGVAPARNTVRADLIKMRKLGVLGLRLNLETGEMRDPTVAADHLEGAARQAIAAGMHLQLHASRDLLARIAPTLGRLGCVVVIDHFGRLDPSEGIDDPKFRALLDLVGSRQIYVKLSAFHRVSRLASYEDLEAVVRALADAGIDRLLWGSDWPHPQRPARGKPVTDQIDPFRQEDDGHCLNLLAGWLRDERALQKVLVSNPQELFEF
ncbi:MAG: amidohydrolase [Lautropia sp.]